MRSRSLIIKIFILFFLLAVLFLVFVWQGQDLGTGYLGWLKQAISKIDVFSVLVKFNPETKLSTSPVLDLFDIKKEDTEDNKIDEENDSSKPQKQVVVKEEIDISEEIQDVIIDNQDNNKVILEPKLSLEDIKEQLDDISVELQEIEQEIDNMLALVEIQEQINDISEQITKISQDIQSLT